MSKPEGFIADLIRRYPPLEQVAGSLTDAYRLLSDCFAADGKILVAGNGGSAADAEHIAGELMKGFMLKRPLPERMRDALESVDGEIGGYIYNSLQGALPVIALDGHYALTTAFMNDCDPSLCFAQQVHGYGKAGDVLWAISTSGNSKNILFASVTAKAKGMKVLALTGVMESRLSALSDVCIKVPESETYKVQEYHLPVYHCLCQMLEQSFFGE